ncbi:MAG: hypothetical protein JWP38_3159 [Herbaspirillum sp.]|nr:hypothetical protein [Herbaspirillum sp.]
MSTVRNSRSPFLALAAACAMFCATAGAADVHKNSYNDSDYQRQRAACLNGSSNEDRTTCLKEAGAAREEARRGNLTDDKAAEQRNAVARCNALPEADRVDCVRRVQGDGNVSGSVDAGGIYRETVTTVPAAPQPAPGQ